MQRCDRQQPAMHVIALNWRDLDNPRAGGAEVHMEEILAHLGRRRGWRCTLLSSRFPGCAQEERKDGYRIVRGGGEYTFHLAAPRLYRRVAAADPADIVLDDVNKIPMLAPLWARRPVIMVVPHLMGRSVFDEVPGPVAALLYGYERLTEPLYRRCHVEVISQSTKDDLVARGWPADRIHVVLCGVDHRTYTTEGAPPKSRTPSIVYVGRLKRYKAIDHLVRAMRAVRQRVPDATLTVVGEGDERTALRELAGQLGLGTAVRFTGFVPSAEKVRRLQEAHVLVSPSVREGWGLTNVEANACGTACVAADSPGLRDSCRDGETGLLYPWGDVATLAERVVRVLTDAALRTRLEAGGRAWAASLTWERCGEETAALIEDVLRTGSGASPRSAAAS
jgi:glycosyltransferase involved in cell wall biosynthesis